MTLATHIVVAGAAAVPFLGNPPLAFLAGLTSHYLIDAIPHWDWPLRSVQKGEGSRLDGKFGGLRRDGGAVFFDLAIASLDMSIGLASLLGVVFLLGAGEAALPLVAASLGGVLPDALQFFYFVLKREPLITHQWFHNFIHTRVKIPHSEVLKGVLLQLPVALLPLIVLFLALH